MMTRTKLSSSFLLALVLAALLATPAVGLGEEPGPVDQQTPSAPAEEFRRFKLVFEPDAYYTDLDLIISLTKAPIPHLGEMTESEIYGALLSRAAILPQFMVVEASINPMPYLGTYIREHNPSFYDRAQVSGSFNWVKAFTAGFEEPYAFSVLAGNVANFRDPVSKDTKGLGYSGYLFSAGNYHIKDNVLIKDDWREFEWKMKGDRKSPVKKLSWSFRVGAKLHGNPDITDIIYLSVRRSRLDYQPEGPSLFNNSGFEYTYDMDRRNLNAIRHFFLVDKKWPFGSGQAAFTLAFGFVWESAKKYSGALAAGREKNDFQVILRPNIEF
jgi:hypothetical protein